MTITQGQLVIWLVIFAAGLIIGGLIAFLLAGRNRNKEPAANPEQEAWLQLRRLYNERASLWQERNTNRFAVHLGDQVFLSSNELSDKQRKTLNAALKDWLVWLGFPASQPQAVEAPVTAPMIAPPPEPVMAGNIAPQTATPADSVPPQSEAKPAQDKPKSIVGQIDEILQEKLKNSQFVNKGVRLTEDPKQGVVVWVGLEHFSGVDAVTDPQVKAILRAAVSEWEQRQSPSKR